MNKKKLQELKSLIKKDYWNFIRSKTAYDNDDFENWLDDIFKKYE